jgi:hypothetical protein
MQKIQLIESGIIEKVIFEGFIYQINPGFENVRLECRDFKGLLENKVLYDNKNYTNETLENIIADLLSDLNSRSAGDDYPETWSYQIDTPVTDITKAFTKGASYFSIFKSL